MTIDSIEIEYFRLATQYYVTGRFASLVFLMPVAGNLFHHAVELYAKGVLSRAVTEQQLKALGHRLPDIWLQFKAQVKNSELDQFDSVITRLNDFETIRYPEQLVVKGAELIVQPRAFPRTKSIHPKSVPVPRYEIVLEEIDSLIDAVFAAAKVNPEFHLAGLSRDAKEFFSRSRVSPR